MDRRVRPRRRGLLALLLLGVLAVVAPQGASASCVGPQLRVDGGLGEGPPTVYVGEVASIRGSYFLNGCGDSIGVSEGGCSSHTVRETVTPMTEVRLELRQHGHTWSLGSQDADHDGRVLWSLSVPADVRPGPAVLVAGTARLRVAVGSHDRG